MHNIHSFKMYSSAMFSLFTKLCNDHLYLVPEHCHHSRRKLYTQQALPFPHSTRPWKTLTCFLSLLLYLFWIFYINETIQYLSFCVCLLSLNILFSKFLSNLISKFKLGEEGHGDLEVTECEK